ncbi:MAG: hypothetical protein HY663_02670 [Chloroflexi bacterium]|nr:hypothetical protein [Chloroflexota bacterium]
MKTIGFRSFMDFCKTLEGHTLPTAGGRARFDLLKAEKERLYYIPKSTGKERIVPKRYIERVLDRYNKGGSLKPTDYNDITRNASYTLALVKLFVKT